MQVTLRGGTKGTRVSLSRVFRGETALIGVSDVPQRNERQVVTGPILPNTEERPVLFSRASRCFQPPYFWLYVNDETTLLEEVTNVVFSRRVQMPRTFFSRRQPTIVGGSHEKDLFLQARVHHLKSEAQPVPILPSSGHAGQGAGRGQAHRD